MTGPAWQLSKSARPRRRHLRLTMGSTASPPDLLTHGGEQNPVPGAATKPDLPEHRDGTDGGGHLCEGEAVTAAVEWERPLLMRIRAGDSAALLELYDRLGWEVYGRAHRITGERLIAEMITVGVFIRVWRYPQEFPADTLRHSLKLLADQRATKWIYE